MTRPSALSDIAPALIAIAVVGSLAFAATGRFAQPPAPADALREYDRLVELARGQAAAGMLGDGDLALGASALPEEARRLMLDLHIVGVSTADGGWAWVRGSPSFFGRTVRYTLVPGGDLGGRASLGRSRHGGVWVEGFYYRWEEVQQARPNPPPHPTVGSAAYLVTSARAAPGG